MKYVATYVCLYVYIPTCLAVTHTTIIHITIAHTGMYCYRHHSTPTYFPTRSLVLLSQCKKVDLSYNLLRTKADVRALSLNAALRRLRIEGNPFCATGVQHGTYQIAMQHLVPGMTLLDGKPPSALSIPLSSTLPLPPPPRPAAPGTTTTGHQQHHPNNTRWGSHRRGVSSCSSPGGRRDAVSTREGFAVSCPLDFAGDLSVERRWRDSAIAAGRSDPEKRKRYPSSARPDGSFSRAAAAPTATDGAGGGSGRDGGGRDDDPCIRATMGGGGPTVASGSYADMFLTALRKDRSTLATTSAADAPDAAAGVSSNNAATFTPALAGRPKEATQHHQHQTGRNGAPATTPGETTYRKRRGNDTLAAAAAAAAAAPTSSLLSYRGLSRAERAAARRLAWSQARQEGAVGAVRGARQQQQRRSNDLRKGKANAPGGGEKSKKTRRTLGARSIEPARSARGHPSVSAGRLSPLLSSLVLFFHREFPGDKKGNPRRSHKLPRQARYC